MRRGDDGERRAPTAALPAMTRCPFCQGSVDCEELAAARHLAFACPKVPAEIQAQALALPGVVPEPAKAGTPGGYASKSRRVA